MEPVFNEKEFSIEVDAAENTRPRHFLERRFSSGIVMLERMIHERLTSIEA